MKFQAPSDFVPDFSKSGGLIAAVAQDAATGEVLMLAWMNREAWDATLATGEAHYWSRSRQKLWHKGESSGNVQIVKAIRRRPTTRDATARPRWASSRCSPTPQ